MSLTILSAGQGIVRYRGVKWWAENGLIHSEDEVTGAYLSHLVRDILERLAGLNDMAKNTKDPSFFGERQAISSYIEQMIALCKTAQRQGRPDDPAAAAQRVQETKDARKARIVVPDRRGLF